MSDAPSSTARDVLERLYSALREGDAKCLLGLLHPGFTAEISPGMPLGMGGPVSSPAAMLTDVWGLIARTFVVEPVVDEIIEVSQARMITRGRYIGSARRSSRTLASPFVHDWRLRDGRIHRLVQVTDTQLWHDALSDEKPDE